jgi:OOP family OmpA-OmpF porin
LRPQKDRNRNQGVRAIKLSHRIVTATRNRCTKRCLKLGVLLGFDIFVLASLARGDVITVSPAEPWPKPGAPTEEEIGRQLKTRGLPHLGILHPGKSPSGTLPSLSAPTIQFEFASAGLKPESIEALRNLGYALNNELKDQKLLLIEGHTDAVGAREYNVLLSDRRAEAVKDYLVREMGVSPDRLRTVGKGSSEPADPKNPCAAVNRRVVVVNLGD